MAGSRIENLQTCERLSAQRVELWRRLLLLDRDAGRFGNRTLTATMSAPRLGGLRRIYSRPGCLAGIVAAAYQPNVAVWLEPQRQR